VRCAFVVVACRIRTPIRHVGSRQRSNCIENGGSIEKKKAKPIYDVLFFHPTSPQYLKYRSDRKAVGQLVCVAERLPLPCLFSAVFLAYVT